MAELASCGVTVQEGFRNVIRIGYVRLWFYDLYAETG